MIRLHWFGRFRRGRLSIVSSFLSYRFVQSQQQDRHEKRARGFTVTPKAIGVDLSVCYKNLIFLRWFCDSFELAWIMEFGLAGI